MEASMRISCFIAALAVLVCMTAVRAEERKFPYEAIIDAADGENVWSGPGSKHYPTMKLNRGDRVIVRRHDPGGWCMISPPEGSFSWVRAAHVKRDGTDRGSLISNRVVVHTGSNLKPEDFTTVQADLSKGDAVEILGEKNFPFDDGPQLMLKIRPIKGEWRWIPRKSIVAVDAMKSDPFSDDDGSSRRRGPVANTEPDAFTRPVSTAQTFQDPSSEPAQDIEGTRRTNTEADQPGKTRLAAIDQQFRDMIQQDPPTWDLDSLANQYKQLDLDIGTQAMRRTIGLRMDAVKRYHKIHRDYVDFYRLTTETRKRDVELQALQSQSQTQLAMADQRRIVASTDGQPMPQPVAQPQPQPSAQPQPQPAAQNSAPASFDGAGIVQKMSKSFPGGPQYVLVAPDGRMLTYLQPSQGVDLNRYVGRSMGITGKRYHRDDWNADTLIVQSLQPVQLRGMR
jgi:hypothetical protein